MAADNKFDEMISIISVPIVILIEELENGGKVSNLLDKEENPSIGSTREVTNDRFDKFNSWCCYLTDGGQQ